MTVTHEFTLISHFFFKTGEHKTCRPFYQFRADWNLLIILNIVMLMYTRTTTTSCFT